MYNIHMRLKIRVNFGNRILGERSGGSVDVCLRGGGSSSENWLGFIDRELAAQIEGARPVKIRAAYYANDNVGTQWHEVPNGEYIQGCAVKGGVYAVYESALRLVSGKTTSSTNQSKLRIAN